MSQTPHEPKPTPEAVRARVSAFLIERGIKQAAVAREADISASRLSAFLSDTYAGDNDLMAERLTAWLDSVARKDSLPAALKGRPPLVETEVSERITDALEWSQSSGDLVAILGEPGNGKTTAIEAYAKRTVSAWAVEMRSPNRKPLAVLEDVCEAVGVPVSSTPAVMLRTVIRQVRNTNGCLVIDEAQHLTPDALEALRGIYDATGIGLVLCGTPGLWKTIGELPQLRSRVGRRVALRKPTKSDVRAIMGGLGVDGKREADFLHTIAQYPGGLRYVVKTIRQAYLLAISAGRQTVAIEDLQAAWAALSTEDGL